jgi:hypothetical protein
MVSLLGALRRSKDLKEIVFEDGSSDTLVVKNRCTPVNVCPVGYPRLVPIKVVAGDNFNDNCASSICSNFMQPSGADAYMQSEKVIRSKGRTFKSVQYFRFV